MANKLWTFINKLDKSTEAGKVNWEQTAEDGVYQASFPDYSVRIFTREGVEGGSLDYVLQILDQGATVIEETSDPELARESDVGTQESFTRMRSLYKNARSRAMGTAQAIEKLMKSLNALDDDDNVPF